jgi:ectoine hydroxylase-related dioxygenase (phytanoyl-CoA dioxygenase family)
MAKAAVKSRKAPAKTVPSKAASAKTAPLKTTPIKTTAMKVAPAKKTPSKIEPTTAAAVKVASAKKTLAKATPTKTAAVKMAPAKKTSAKAASSKTAAVKMAPAEKTPVKAKRLKRLPRATTDLDQVKADFDEYGYGLIKDCLSPLQVSEIRERMIEQARLEIPHQGLAEAPSQQRLRFLPNKGRVFTDLILQPQVTALMKHGFHDLEFCMSSMAGTMTSAGAPGQMIHCDQTTLPGSVPKAWVNNAIYMISEFTEANGGTRVVPGSHKGPPPTIRRTEDGGYAGYDGETAAIEGDPGTTFVFDGRLWHGAGEPRVSGRIAIVAFYVISVLRQAENYTACLHDDVYERLSREQREMLGFKRASTLNYIEPQQDGGRGNTDTPMPYTPALSADGGRRPRA